MRLPVLILAILAMASFAVPAGAFIGAGITLDKHLGDTINFNLDPTLVQAAGIASGGAAMNLGVTWGVDYDINSLAGYPYGYGGVGAVTDGDIGYNLGLSMNAAQGTSFDGSSFGIPLTEGSQSTTTYDKSIAANDHLQSTVASLLY